MLPYHGQHLNQPEASLALVGSRLHLNASNLHWVVPARQYACGSKHLVGVSLLNIHLSIHI